MQLIQAWRETAAEVECRCTATTQGHVIVTLNSTKGTSIKGKVNTGGSVGTRGLKHFHWGLVHRIVTSAAEPDMTHGISYNTSETGAPNKPRQLTNSPARREYFDHDLSSTPMKAHRMPITHQYRYKQATFGPCDCVWMLFSRCVDRICGSNVFPMLALGDYVFCRCL